MKTFFFGCLAVLLANPLANAWGFDPGESKTILDEKVVDFPLNLHVDSNRNFYNHRHYMTMSNEYIENYSFEQAKWWSKPLHLELKPELYQELISRDHKKISYHFEFLTSETWINPEAESWKAIPIPTSGLYAINFDQYFQLEPNQNLRFALPNLEKGRFVDNEVPGWMLADLKLNLSREKGKNLLNLTARSGVDLMASINTYRRLDYCGVLFQAETYLQKIIIKIDTQKENLLKIPMQFQTLIDQKVEADPRDLKNLYMQKLRDEVFPKVHLAFSQTIWDFERFENECNWTNYNPKSALNTLNFTLHPLDPQVLGEVKFRLFVQKQVPINLKLAKHYQLKVSPEKWVELIKKEVKDQGYPTEWLTYNLTGHQLRIESTNPLAFQFEPIVLTYEVYKPPVPPKKEPDPEKPKDKTEGKDKTKPTEKPKEKDKVKESEKPKSKDKDQPKEVDQPKVDSKDKTTPEVKQPEVKPEVKTPDVTEKVKQTTAKKGFNVKYLYFLFIPFAVLVLYLIIFFWKKHKHKKGKC